MGKRESCVENTIFERHSMRSVIKILCTAICVFFFFSLSVVKAEDQKLIAQIKQRNITHLRTKLLPQIEDMKASIKSRKIETRLNHLISRKIKGRDKAQNEKIKVMLKISRDANDISGQIRNHGARVLKRRGTTAVVEVSIDRLEQMVDDVDAIKFAGLPPRIIPLEEVSEGIGITGANILHNYGYKGSGVKIAVIDPGFKGLTEAINNGEIPGSVITHDYTGKGVETRYYHGTACAEIIHDMAPNAELYLLKIYDAYDVMEAIEFCVNNNIDIISFSAGMFGTGPGDGTGFIDELFDELRETGILVIAAAGNAGNQTEIINGIPLTMGSHWEGTFNDLDDDDFHEFIRGDRESYYNIIASVPMLDDDGEDETDEVSIIMRWNDWPEADVDYDMFVVDYNPETGEIGDLLPENTSMYLQDGTQPPLEAIFIDLPYSENYLHYYILSVVKQEGEPSGVELELSLSSPGLFVPFEGRTEAIAVASGSIMEPADAESVLAVGAIDYQNWEDGPQEDFSSQGPTNAWAGSSARIKPDICAPDGITTYSYGVSSFHGTSASTPHVTGAAALILSRDPDLSPDELQSLLESNAIDMGDVGKDNLYGWGKMDLSFALMKYSSWKLVSLQREPTNLDIVATLESILNRIISVWTYEGGEWNVYDPNNPDFSDLSQLNAGKGYWLHLSEPLDISCSGTEPSKSIDLLKGWNLVGYNSDTAQPVDIALGSIKDQYIISVWAYMGGVWKVYDPLNLGFSDLTIMEPGYGYWINASAVCTWTIP
jgi:subtilisin family serine protease